LTWPFGNDGAGREGEQGGAVDVQARGRCIEVNFKALPLKHWEGRDYTGRARLSLKK